MEHVCYYRTVNVSSPILDVIPGHRGALLAALTNLTTGKVTGRQLARYADVPVTTTHRILEELVGAGIVRAEDVGSATLFQLNRGHLAAAGIIELAGIRTALAERLRDELRRFQSPPVAGWLFGSAARGDGTSSSDIDIALVAADGVDLDEAPWAADVALLSASVVSMTGNAPHVDSYTPAEFRRVSQGGFAAKLQGEGLELVTGGLAAVLAGR